MPRSDFAPQDLSTLRGGVRVRRLLLLVWRGRPRRDCSSRAAAAVYGLPLPGMSRVSSPRSAAPHALQGTSGTL